MTPTLPDAAHSPADADLIRRILSDPR